MRSAPAILLTVASLLAGPRVARAQTMPRAVVDGERYGTLVPDGATSVRIDREALAFTLAPSLDVAAVTASYQLTNGGAAAGGVDVTFAYVRGERGDGDPAAHAALEADGAPLSFRAVTDAGLLEPKLRDWLEAHPDVNRELAAEQREDADAGAEATTPKLRALVADAGGKCRPDCSRLTAWYRNATGDDEHRLSTNAEDEALLEAAREAVPAAAAELAARWSELAGNRADARLGFLFFHLDFKPGQTRSVTVRYEHRAGVHRTPRVNPTYGFDYLLSSPRPWAGAGPVEVSVRVPGKVQLGSASQRFSLEGDTYRARLQGPGDGWLRFDVMPLDGLWLGMTQPRGYWAILVFAVASTALAVGVAAGRFWSSASRWKRLLLPLLAAGPVSAACSLAVLVVLLVAFPPDALGFGYEGLLRGGLLVLAASLVGALSSAAGGAWRARRARRLARAL